MKATLVIIFSIFSYFVYGQNEFSSHSIQFYKNNSEKKIIVSKVSIVVDGKKINGEKTGENYLFPILDSNKTFELTIKVNGRKFQAKSIDSWRLNNGSEIIFVVINRIDKLLSVAKYNNMDKKDGSFEILSSRFFLVDKRYIFDVKNYNKIKRLDCLIINPNQEGDGSYLLIQKIIKLKK